MLACSKFITVYAVAAGTVVVKSRRHLAKPHNRVAGSALVNDEERVWEILATLKNIVNPISEEFITDSFKAVKLPTDIKSLLRGRSFLDWFTKLQEKIGSPTLTMKIVLNHLQSRYSNAELAKMLHAASDGGIDFKLPLFEKWKQTFDAAKMFSELGLHEAKFENYFLTDPVFLIWIEYARYIDPSSWKSVLDVLDEEFVLHLFVEELLKGRPDPKTDSVQRSLILQSLLRINDPKPLPFLDLYATLQSADEMVENPFLRHSAVWLVEYAQHTDMKNWPRQIVNVLQREHPVSDLARWAVEAEAQPEFQTVGKAVVDHLIVVWKEEGVGKVINSPKSFEEVQEILQLRGVAVSSVVDNLATKVLVQYMFTTFYVETAVEELSVKLLSWLEAKEYRRLLVNDGKWPLDADMRRWLRLLLERDADNYLTRVLTDEELARNAVRAANREKKTLNQEMVPVPQRTMGIHAHLKKLFHELALDVYNDNLFTRPDFVYFFQVVAVLKGDDRKSLLFMDNLLERLFGNKFKKLAHNAITGPTDCPAFEAALDLVVYHWLRRQKSSEITILISDMLQDDKLSKNFMALIQREKEWLAKLNYYA
ncbi:hypothetical protein CCR75_007327 [Bremia lactucae]|uniref:RxLR effector protein n=1 Tax=Bremia lactucae TaxID=4779 RepID=A0A976FHP3_BRELC|nr:hypothetical protein CCR75_007327 [Bremia lactucae]